MTASLPSLADSLIQALHQPGQERLLDLVRNPLRLTLLCITWDGTLPETQAQLYENYLKKFYDWNQNLQELRDCAERCQTNITALKKQLNQQLGELAKAALDLPQERFRLSQALVEKYLGEELDDQSLCYLALQLGWLNRVGKDNRGQFIFAFYHATFQEYFAALAVDDWDYFLPRNHVDFPVAGKEYRIFEPQWKQVILLWLGREDVAYEGKEGFIEALVNFEDEVSDFYRYRAYFLAAVGISEFKSCTLADAIVQQVVKSRFGYFNEEKHKWFTFLELIEEVAGKNLIQTDRKRTIQELSYLVQNPQCPEVIRRKAAKSLEEIDPGNQQAITYLVRILENIEDEVTRIDVAESLGEIDAGNPQAIAALVKIIETTEDKVNGWQAAESLGRIGQNNAQAIAALVRVLDTTEDEFIHFPAAESLGKIGQNNAQAIAALVRVLDTTKDEFIRKPSAESLGKIGQGNPQAIAALFRVLETTQDEDTRMRVAYDLGNIGRDNSQVAAALVRILDTTQDENTRSLTAMSLGKLDPGNPQAIAALVRIIENTENEGIKRVTASSLAKLDPGNPQAIATLVRIIENTEHKDTHWLAAIILEEIGQHNAQAIASLVRIIETTDNEGIKRVAASSLGEIDPGNPQAINALLRILETTEDEVVCWLTASSLGEIDPGNLQAITALLTVLTTTENEGIKRVAASSLGEIDPRNPQAIAALLRILTTTENESVFMKTAKSLEKIITTNEQRQGLVFSLKPRLKNGTNENNFDLFENCYKVVWNIAQELPYPDFYRAWHGLTETQTSRLVQTLNLAQLPQLLQTQLTETNLHQTLQLLCIDGSKFDNRDNPATDIYLQLVKKHHCPKFTEGTPRTLTELKIYWQLLDWEKHPILIFYEEAKPQGFSQTFLDFLDRFDATICAIADSPHPTISTFSPQDPHLIQTIITWLQRTVLES